jgi:hypothetical protein
VSDQSTLRLGEPDVWIIDASALIELKRAIGVADQWDLLMRMRDMVVGGELAAPRQVFREVSDVMHPDAPGAWAASARQVQTLPLDVAPDFMRQVLVAVPNLTDTTKLEEDADPYVVGLARQLEQGGSEVCVITEDRTDHISVSIATACEELGIEWMRLRQFLDVLGIRYRAERQTG